MKEDMKTDLIHKYYYKHVTWFFRYLLFTFHHFLQSPKADQNHKYTSPVLEFHELIVNLLNVDLAPRDVVVGRNAIDDVIIEFVELL